MYPCNECEKSENEWVQIGLLNMYPCREWVQTGLLIMYPCGKEIEKSCTYL